MNFIAIILGTFFYIGYLPLIPGTFGSLAGLVLFYAVKHNPAAYLLLALALTGLGFLFCGRAERITGQKDARPIVLDEVSGMFLSLVCLPYYNPAVFITAFCLFRILDAFKPYPAGPLEKLKGSIGIMGDDLVAAIYTNIILQVVLRLASLRAV